MTQQFSKVLPRPKKVVDTIPVLDKSHMLIQSSTGINIPTKGEVGTHTIRKIIKNNSVEYFCNECNTHYSQLNWLLDDHPVIDIDKFTVHDLRKEEI